MTLLPALEALDDGDYHPRLRATRGPALVLFGAPGCGACRVAEQRLPQIAGDISLFKVDVQVSQGLARELDIFHLPALLLYRDGRFHAHIRAAIAPATLPQAIAEALARTAEDEP